LGEDVGRQALLLERLGVIGAMLGQAVVGAIGPLTAVNEKPALDMAPYAGY
jgi:hypothetical protein